VVRLSYKNDPDFKIRHEKNTRGSTSNSWVMVDVVLNSSHVGLGWVRLGYLVNNSYFNDADKERGG
jgi:hypothetical protein